MKVAGIVLAAGESRRMGTPKQKLAYNGVSLLRRAAEAALASSLASVYVVVGAHETIASGELAGLGVNTVRNPNWGAGMGTSVTAGARAALAANAELDALAILLADQPLVTAAVINRLLAEAQAAPESIIAASYSATLGVPAIFKRACFARLLALPEHSGAKALIASHPESVHPAPCPEAAIDIDTPEEHAALHAATHSARGNRELQER